MGRPTLLTPAVSKVIVQSVSAGASREGAAKAAGISRACLQEWLQRGKNAVDGDELYADFVDEILKAEGRGELEAVEHLKLQSLEGKTPATLKWLSRLNPEVWGDKSTVTHDVREGAGSNEANDLDVARSVVAALESSQKPEDI